MSYIVLLYIFLFSQSSVLDERGRPYGIGSLTMSFLTGKRKFSTTSSSTYNSLQQQLEEAQRQIQAQSTHNSRLEERLEAEQAQRLLLKERLDTQQSQHASSKKHFTMIEQYLRKTDPAFLDFCEEQSGLNPSSP